MLHKSIMFEFKLGINKQTFPEIKFMTAREGLLTSVSCQNDIGSFQDLSDSRFLPGPQLSPQILDFPFQIAPLAFVTSLLHFILSMHLMFFYYDCVTKQFDRWP